MKDSSSLGQLLVRVNLINEDQLKYAEEEVKFWTHVQMQSVTKKRIGEMLLDQGFITQEQLNEALEKQKTSGGKRLGSILVDLKFIQQDKLMKILCSQFEVPYVKLDSIKLDAIKTKDIVKMLAALSAAKKTLIVLPEKDDVIYRSARNIEGVKVVPVNTLCVYDILNADTMVIAADAVSKIEEVYA